MSIPTGTWAPWFVVAWVFDQTQIYVEVPTEEACYRVMIGYTRLTHLHREGNRIIACTQEPGLVGKGKPPSIEGAARGLMPGSLRPGGEVPAPTRRGTPNPQGAAVPRPR